MGCFFAKASHLRYFLRFRLYSRSKGIEVTYPCTGLLVSFVSPEVGFPFLASSRFQLLYLVLTVFLTGASIALVNRKISSNVPFPGGREHISKRNLPRYFARRQLPGQMAILLTNFQGQVIIQIQASSSGREHRLSLKKRSLLL
jgi:hypothetical protein